MITVYIIFALVVFSIVSALLYFHLGWFKKFYHDVIGWHQPADESNSRFDGLSFHCTCKYCGKDIMQDSQGNWY